MRVKKSDRSLLERLRSKPPLGGEIGKELGEAGKGLREVPAPNWKDKEARARWREHPKVVRWLRIKYAVDALAMKPGFDLNKLSEMKLSELLAKPNKE